MFSAVGSRASISLFETTRFRRCLYQQVTDLFAITEHRRYPIGRKYGKSQNRLQKIDFFSLIQHRPVVDNHYFRTFSSVYGLTFDSFSIVDVFDIFHGGDILSLPIVYDWKL